MARNRKRAKERRARHPEPVATTRGERDEPPAPTGHSAPDAELAEAQLALGRPELVSDSGVQPEPEPEDEDEEFDSDEEEVESAGDEEEVESAEVGRGRPGRTADGAVADGGGGDGIAAPHPVVRQRPGNRLITFLQGSWRELQRVQWPDRRQVIQATGVVIGFVIVAGVYLGVADELASKLVNFVLK